MAAMHEFGGVPRMGGQMGGVGVGLGMSGSPTAVWTCAQAAGWRRCEWENDDDDVNH
jgi:hypothetical protein